jgi:hypothetical protein
MVTLYVCGTFEKGLHSCIAKLNNLTFVTFVNSMKGTLKNFALFGDSVISM